MSVGEVNAAISGAIGTLEESLGAHAHEEIILEAYGIGPAEQKLEELKDTLPGWACIDPGVFLSIGYAAEKAQLQLGGALEGSNNTESAAAVQASLVQAQESDHAKNSVFDAMTRKSGEIWAALEGLTTLIRDYRNLTLQYSEHVTTAEGARDAAIENLRQLHIADH